MAELENNIDYLLTATVRGRSHISINLIIKNLSNTTYYISNNDVLNKHYLIPSLVITGPVDVWCNIGQPKDNTRISLQPNQEVETTTMLSEFCMFEFIPQGLYSISILNRVSLFVTPQSMCGDEEERYSYCDLNTNITLIERSDTLVEVGGICSTGCCLMC